MVEYTAAGGSSEIDHAIGGLGGAGDNERARGREAPQVDGAVWNGGRGAQRTGRDATGDLVQGRDTQRPVLNRGFTRETSDACDGHYPCTGFCER